MLFRSQPSALPAQMAVSIDGRYETLYPQSAFVDNMLFYYPPYQLGRAFRYPTQLLMIPSDREILIDKLLRVPGLKEIYSDEVTVLFSTRPDGVVMTHSNENNPTELDQYR